MPQQPKNPFHPGEYLLDEFLDLSAISQAEFAQRIGWTETRLNELICGKRGVSAEAALDLAEALHTSARLWMNLQTTWDLGQKLKPMTIALIQDLASDLCDEQRLSDYVAARVRGDTHQATPPINWYHGIEDYKDVLVSLTSDPTFTDTQRRWFWNAVLQVAEETWRSGDDEPFRRIVALAWRVTLPSDGVDRLDFLPNDSTGFRWNDEKWLLVGAHALLWLQVWEARPDPGFWRENLKAILEQAPPGDSKYLALVRAVDGVGTLDRELWFALIRDALCTEHFPTSMMRTVLLGQWQRAGHKPNTEIRLIQTVGEGLAKVQQTSRHRSSWKLLLQLLEEWQGVQWTGAAQKNLHRLMRESRLFDPASQGADTQSQWLVSPKAFNRNNYSGLRLAA